MKTLTTIPVELGERSYPIRIGRGWIEGLGNAIQEIAPRARCCVVTDPEIERHCAAPVLKSLAAANLQAELLTILRGEEAKSVETVSKIYDFLISRKFDRNSVLVALGGGVVGDVTGFAAATFLRGVALVQIPTTLLAMVDSSVGGKTGVNHPLGKNLIGAFKQPALVGIELDFLRSLPVEDYRSGLAEVVKYGMIADPDLFAYIESNRGAILERDPEALLHLVARSCEIKAAVVAEDEEELGLRAILNFGHTFAHAVEKLARYGEIRHGEAVAMGMAAACRLGERVARFGAASTQRLTELLAALGLPVRLPRFGAEEYLEVMRSDKKVRSGRLRFVVPLEIGRVELRDDIEESLVAEVLKNCSQAA